MANVFYKPREVVEKDLPPSPYKKALMKGKEKAMKAAKKTEEIWKNGKERTTRSAKRTAKFVKSHGLQIGLYLYLGFIPINGFLIADHIDPAKSPKKLKVFAEKYSSKLAPERMANFFWKDGKVLNAEIDWTPYYFLADGVDQDTWKKLNEALKKSNFRVSSNGLVSATAISYGVTVVLLEPKSFQENGKPSPKRVREEFGDCKSPVAFSPSDTVEFVKKSDFAPVSVKNACAADNTLLSGSAEMNDLNTNRSIKLYEENSKKASVKKTYEYLFYSLLGILVILIAILVPYFVLRVKKK
jgi:hypothetical protein